MATMPSTLNQACAAALFLCGMVVGNASTCLAQPISQLPAATSANPGDLIPATQSGVTRRVTVGQINASPLAATAAETLRAQNAEAAITSAINGAPAYQAATGTTQANATPVAGTIVYITSGGAGAGMILVGTILNVRIINTTSAFKLIYPVLTGTINGSAVNAPVEILPGGSAQFASPSGLAWSAG